MLPVPIIASAQRSEKDQPKAALMRQEVCGVLASPLSINCPFHALALPNERKWGHPKSRGNVLTDVMTAENQDRTTTAVRRV